MPPGTSSPLPGMPSAPTVTNGSSALNGTNTVPLPLTVWSTPWSKNCPKNVNKLLNGGDRPTSVVTLGMNSVVRLGRATRRLHRLGLNRARRRGSEHIAALGAHREPVRRNRRRVVDALIDDQVADHPRLRVEHSVALGLLPRSSSPGRRRVAGAASAVLKSGLVSRGNGHVRRSKLVTPGDQVVARTIDRTQTVRRQIIRNLVRTRPDQRLAVLRIARLVRIRTDSETPSNGARRS